MDYYLDEDFYNFDRYESHEDYLPNPNQRNPRFNRNGNNNRPFVRVGNNNRNRSNSTGGMFSIQIANDNYDGDLTKKVSLCYFSGEPEEMQ